MAKTEARNTARIMFVERGLNRKEIAARLNVREKTVGDWATKGGWDDLRAAHLTSSQSVVATLKGLIQTYTEKLTELEQVMGADPREKARLVDALVKTSKTLDVVRAEGDITLSARIKVMDWVFSELQKADPAIHLQLVEFQAYLLDEAGRMHT